MSGLVLSESEKTFVLHGVEQNFRYVLPSVFEPGMVIRIRRSGIRRFLSPKKEPQINNFPCESCVKIQKNQI